MPDLAVVPIVVVVGGGGVGVGGVLHILVCRRVARWKLGIS